MLTLLSAPVPAAAQQENCGEVYTIRRGDTLAKIANRCDTTIDLLMISNPHIKNPNRIFSGQDITIPGQPEEVEQVTQAKPELARELEVESDERWINIDLSEQMLYAMEGEEVVASFIVSTGRWRTPTVTGTYRIYLKYEYDDMRGPGYYLEDVPFTMYFHKGYGIHGTYWHDNFGTPMSHGCVNLRTEDAAWLFEFAPMGAIVNVHP